MSRSPSQSPTSGLFKVIERDATLASRVSEEIERLIVENHLSPGERMPSERELGDRFGVSRTVIREAVRSLAAKGLVTVQTGDGTYVQKHSHTNASEALARLLRLTGLSSPSKGTAVYEVRRPLEIAIAGFAAERATADDLAALQSSLKISGTTGLSEAQYVEADVRFHLALAQATRNPLFPALLNSVSDLMTAIRELGLAVDNARGDGLHHHQKIYDRVAAQDVEGARRAMSSHMDESERIMQVAIGQVQGAS